MYSDNQHRPYQQGGSSSRSTPSPPDSYPPNSDENNNNNHNNNNNNNQNQNQNNMSAPRGFRTGSAQSSHNSSGGEESLDPRYNQNNYSYSNPSLPRYSSGQSVSSSINYAPNPSPLNPTAMRGGGGRDGAISATSSRFSGNNNYNAQGNYNNGNGNSPLSNAMYMDSTPTLTGSDPMRSGEKLRMGGGDGLGDYTSGRDLARTNTGGYRRGPPATGLKAFYRAMSGANLGDSGKDERHIKLPRLGYLDGCKFIAACVVLNGTLFDAVLSSTDYGFIQRNSPLYIVRSTNLGITFLLLLMGRSLITPLWDVPSPSGNINSSSSNANSALISWARLTRAMLVRPFRFILPVISIVALQWGLASTGLTNNCNNVGMDAPYWGLITSFAGFSTLVFDLFTWYEQNTIAGKTFGANLWVMPWFFQSSYAVYVTHLMLGNLSSNRYWVYGVLAFFSWTTFNYFFVAIMGLALADMHAHGHLHRVRTKWPMYQRLTLHFSLIALACCTQFIPVVRNNINYGMSVINVQDHPELTFSDSIFAVCWLICIETSGIAQNVFGNIVMRNLGKFSAGMFLLAPAVTFTIVPDLALQLHNNKSSASTILGLSWVVLFFTTFVGAIVFHFLVELPSKMIGEVVAEILEMKERGVIPRRADGTKLLKKSSGAANLKQRPVLA